MQTSRLLRGFSFLGLFFCAAGGFAQNPPPTPVPLITQVTPPSLPPASLSYGSNNFTLTILGANFVPGEMVTLSGFSVNAIAYTPTVNATGTQIVANFTNVWAPVPTTLTVTVTKRDMTGAILLASNPYYLPVTPSNPSVLLEAPVTSFVQGSLSGMAAADFNGDGVVDLAVVSQASNTLSILKGNSGTFTTGASYPTGSAPSGIVAADFNGDGVPDLAVTNALDNSVTIFLGNGNGTFQAGTTVSEPGVYPAQLVAGDFNGDGKMDLAVLNACGTGQNGCFPTAEPTGPGNVAIFLGNGDGTFTVAPALPATGIAPTAIAVADLNGDGFIDLIVANSSNNLTLLMGNGDGTFTAAQDIPLTGFVGPPTGIAIGDFNGDGALDVAVTSSGDNIIAVLLNQNCAGLPAAQCSLSPAQIPTMATTGLTGIVTADMNADGFLDLVVINSQAGSVSVLLGDGTGHFTLTGPPPAQSFPVGDYPQALALVDFSMDGRLDVVTANQSGTYSLLQQKAVAPVRLASSSTFPSYGQVVNLTAFLSPPIGPAPTGTVTLYDGSTSVGSAVVSGNQASLQFTALTVGTRQLTAVYDGDGNYIASTSNAETEYVSQAQTTVTLGSNVNTVSFGQPFTLTATVQPQNTGTPTGTVNFFDTTNSTSLGSADLSNGAAQLILSNVSPGAHVITAIYSGDSNFTGSSSPTYQENITQASTTITVTTSANPVTFGQTPTFTATVQPSASTAATGYVAFFDGSAQLGTAPVTNNTAQLLAPVLSVGAHNITAQYAGDTNYSASTSASITQTVNQLSTTTTLASSLNPATAGQGVTFTATVQAGTGNSATGTITFLDGSATLGTITVSNNSAQLTTSSLAPGSHSITAAYGGSTNFAGSTSAALAETINQVGTTTTLSSNVNPALAGQGVTFTATVQAGAGNSATGTVNFMDGSTTLGSVTLTSNSAQLTVSTLAAGSHTITGVYTGSTNFAGSTSAALTETINQSSTTTTLVSNLNPATFGQAVPFVATVQTTSGGPATGSVTFYDGTAILGTAAVVNNNSQHNVAQLTFSGLQGGTHTITAAYGGDANYTASSSSTLTQTINPASTSVTVGASSNPASFGQAVMLTATIVPSVNGTLATGSVTFFDGANSLGSANLSNNVAQISVGNFALGSHSITAKYTGDRNFTGSTSSALSEVVNPAPTSTVLTSSANPTIVKNTVTFTATVSSSIGGTQSGNVSFYLDGSSTAAATVNISSGIAKYSTNSLSAGSHSVVAVFNSTNADFAGSTSPTFTQFVSDFTVAVSPSSLTVARGTSGTYTLTVTPVGEFSGTVSLTCGGAPGGTNCAISPTQVTLTGSGPTQATVTISAAQNASTGTHTLTFTGTSGGLNHKVTASLTID